jgi:hypothetical protein
MIPAIQLKAYLRSKFWKTLLCITPNLGLNEKHESAAEITAGSGMVRAVHICVSVQSMDEAGVTPHRRASMPVAKSLGSFLTFNT